MTTIRKIIKRDIGQKVEGVVKVFDQSSLATEIREYVVTDKIEEELKRIFDTFTHVSETIRRGGAARDVVGMWISGFFGSGKSHFAKVLGYLLAERPTRRRLRRLLQRCLRQASVRWSTRQGRSTSTRGGEARHQDSNDRIRDQEPTIADQPQLRGRDPHLGVLPAHRPGGELRRRTNRGGGWSNEEFWTSWPRRMRPSSGLPGGARKDGTIC